MPEISDLITRMNNQGVNVCIENGNLRVNSDTQLNNEQRRYLKKYKQKIIEYLIEDRFEAGEERAAIMEYDGHLPRAEAEKHAIEKHIKPYHFLTTDGGGTYRGCETLDETRSALE